MLAGRSARGKKPNVAGFNVSTRLTRAKMLPSAARHD